MFSHISLLKTMTCNFGFKRRSALGHFLLATCNTILIPYMKRLKHLGIEYSALSIDKL